MRSTLTRHMQTAILASHIGEPVKVWKGGEWTRGKGKGYKRPAPVTGRAVFSAGPTVVGGAPGAEIVSAADTFTFYKNNADLAAAVASGSVIERVEGGDEFIVDSFDANDVHRLVVVVVRWS